MVNKDIPDLNGNMEGAQFSFRKDTDNHFGSVFPIARRHAWHRTRLGSSRGSFFSLAAYAFFSPLGRFVEGLTTAPRNPHLCSIIHQSSVLHWKDYSLPFFMTLVATQ